MSESGRQRRSMEARNQRERIKGRWVRMKREARERKKIGKVRKGGKWVGMQGGGGKRTWKQGIKKGGREEGKKGNRGG